MMKMVEKIDEENHFSWCCFLLQLPLLFFLVTLVAFLAILYFLSSHGSSLLVSIAILFISTVFFFLRFFKKRTRIYFAERSGKQDDDAGNDDADAGNVVDDADDDEVDVDDEDGLIEIALVSEEGKAIEARRNIYQSPKRIRVDEDEEEDIDDVNMEEDNLIEIDISIGSIKRVST
ncbi:hypothetical protein N665_0338s0039 [Sinapis alba]|nr:hypothetical protein N665_0338s0039 [Sinapis alba]